MKNFRVSGVLIGLLATLLTAACVSTAPPKAVESQAHVGTGAVILKGSRPTKLGAVQYTATHRSAAMTDLVTAISTTGALMILTGSQPATVATVDGGTILAVLSLSSTAGTVTGGVLTFNTITSATASGTGTAAHFLICTTTNTANCVAVSSTTRILQGSVATSGADINFGSVAFTSGQTIAVSSLTITANGA